LTTFAAVLDVQTRRQVKIPTSRKGREKWGTRRA